MEDTMTFEEHGDIATKQAELAAYADGASMLPKLDSAAGITKKWADNDARTRDDLLAHWAGHEDIQADIAIKWDKKRQSTISELSKYEQTQMLAASEMHDKEYFNQSSSATARRIAIRNQTEVDTNTLKANKINEFKESRISAVKREYDLRIQKAKESGDSDLVKKLQNEAGDKLFAINVGVEGFGAEVNKNTDDTIRSNAYNTILEDIDDIYSKSYNKAIAISHNELMAKQTAEETCRNWAKNVANICIQNGNDADVMKILDIMTSKSTTINNVHDEDGNVVEGKFDFRPTFYWTEDDRKELTKACLHAADARAAKRKNELEIAHQDNQKKIVSLRAQGDKICASTELDSQELDTVLNQLNTIATSTGEKSANEAYEHLVTQRDKHLRIIGEAERKAKTIDNVKALNAMWNEYDSKRRAYAAHIVFGDGSYIDEGVIDAKKEMCVFIRSALSNGVFKGDDSAIGVWTKRLREIEEGINADNYENMLEALKNAGFSVDVSKTKAGESEGARSFSESVGNQTDVPLRGWLKISEDGSIVVQNKSIQFLYTDENGTEWQVSNNTMNTLLDIMASKKPGTWSSEKTAIEPEDIRKILVKAINTGGVKKRKWGWVSYDNIIDSTAIEKRLMELTTADLSDDTATMSKLQDKTTRRFGRRVGGSSNLVNGAASLLIGGRGSF